MKTSNPNPPAGGQISRLDSQDNLLVDARRANSKKSGFTLMEMLVFLFIFVVVVLSFYQSFNLGINYILESKNRLAATEIANEKMEIIRSLDYYKIGTKQPNGSGGWIYGSPSGDILLDETVSKNTRAFFVKTLVQYINDPTDGTPTSTPADPRPNDYKNVSVQVSWDAGMDPKESVFSVSTFVPQGIEAASTKGIVSVATGVPYASVRLSDSVVSFDQTYPADDGGYTMFFDLPQDLTGHYNLEISKSGYFPVHTLPPYDPAVPGSFDAVDKNFSVTNGVFQPITIGMVQTSNLSINTKDMLGNSVPNVDFLLEGGRVMGHEVPSSKVVFSYKQNGNSGSGGNVAITDSDGIAAGTYTCTTTPPSGYEFVKMDSATATSADKFVLPPAAAAFEATALFAKQDVDSFLAMVEDGTTHNPIKDASVELKNTALGYDVTLTTDQFGKAFFPNDSTPLATGQTYDITVTATGYTDLTDTVTINALTKKTLSLTL